MKKVVAIVFLALVFAIPAAAQPADSTHRKELLKQFLGQWRMTNDTLSFDLVFKDCKQEVINTTVDAICGFYICVDKKTGNAYTSDNGSVGGNNAYTDLSLYPNSIGIYFLDKLKKKTTTGIIEVVGDTLYWEIRPHIDTYDLTVNGKHLGGPVYPKGWSVPIKAVLYRVKGEKE